MPALDNITQFLSFDVPGKDCRWLTQSDWSQNNIIYFQRVWRQRYSSLTAPPPGQNRKESGYLRTQLVLEKQDTPEAIAIIHSYPGYFSSEHITAYFEPQIENKEKLEALESLVTACFYITQTDCVRLYVTSKDQHPDLSKWGEWRTVGIMEATKSHEAPIKTITMTNCIVISRNDWQTNRIEKQNGTNLSHLKTFGERLTKRSATNCHCTKPKRSFLARIFRPKIDDSIF